MGSGSTVAAIMHWPNANEFHNSVPALFSPILVWFTYGSLSEIRLVLQHYGTINFIITLHLVHFRVGMTGPGPRAHSSHSFFSG